ncbi:FAD dependent oxidoreductase [Kalmanozyma brasiliensis GHG001]|uniref:FAD dependent oxidoreductase domain-containing protein n=1 Tax=Kalmanozyma brasiliensis (strain GHG001) TaxID=1365824 RepID=V5ENP1_KALBG|nr:FAD dependent oxidoreductase [Kalmanozyma brasiliensis GHG001]EST04528.1 FAD dependent oxidoreductase [Kalmanozyma brasiliensis GHG001]
MSTSDYLIIGAGVNGTSIASTLISLGHTVTLLDRSSDGHVAPDGASHDLNKIVRADYTDANYCSLAKEAISRWRADPVLAKFYHEVGVLFRSSDKGQVFGGEGSAEEYVEAGVRHAHLDKDKHLEVFPAGAGERERAFKLTSDDQLASLLSGVTGGLGDGLKGMGERQTGYFNPRGGWAEANNACRALLDHAITRGVAVHVNARVVSFVYADSDVSKVTGVRTSDGRTFHADHIVLAAGAWTNDLLTALLSTSTDVAPSKWMTRPSAQCVAILRVTPSEAASLRNTPVIINFSSGFYQFEPTRVGDEWHMKIAYHSNGYLWPRPPVECNGSYPAFEDSIAAHPTGARSIGDEGTTEDVGYDMASSTIPASRLSEMLTELAQIYPSLASPNRVVSTRVCWYSDTLDENWILDRLSRHPAAQGRGDNVWVITGDSGHAYKFLPIIGDLFATIAGLQDNERDWDLTRFTFEHQAKLHRDKSEGKKIESADSNRFDGGKEGENARARL